MTTSTTTSRRRTTEVPVEHVNEVRLVGRLSAEAVELTMPSGDTLWTFRLVVARNGGDVRAGQQFDTLDCAVWSGRVKRSVSTWAAGDVVEVTGAIRRRFYAAGQAKVSRYQVEVAGGRVIRRATSG
jgi:single-strand DNA-binding protein